MKRSKKKAIFWSAAGLLFSLAAVLVVLGGLKGNVRVTDPEGIPGAANAVMTAVRDGDWDGLNGLVTQPQELTPQTGGEGSAERLIWDAYRQSLQWECPEDFRLQEARVTQAVSVTCLDIAAVTGAMNEHLPEIADSNADMTREQALAAAAEAVLSAGPPVTRKQITMTFVRSGGQWKLVPDKALLALLSGFTAS